ncbi:metalloregulator ArsR/SmtB family transcription factor [Nocardia sp. NEAU-G5]|uniref:Metalloregulator ArsR/SmtB family transcription factor n=1 Tax=Nocardia albiluteola TaxID=2842303 RepID=A0ABS6B397_9NOCA|nr:metalloregulator ArsR/SmtB family transcription factor [Nocardia albiluteola]MBU3063704.1 metalloregulator ArsR/SmtB family transcription factor [Nocardia albiluteola]
MDDEACRAAVFKALADDSRRRLLDSLNAHNGQTLRQLCAGLEMTRQAVSKHLAVLESANLVSTRRNGREKLHYLNAEPINAIADRWINRYDRGRTQALADLKSVLESVAMTSEDTHMTTRADTTDEFVYTTYIRTTPEQLWRALTEPEFTRRYWGATFETDWRAGSSMVWQQRDWTGSDPAQQVLVSEPYRRLAYTWHTFDAAFGREFGFSTAELAAFAAEPRSTVSFEIEPQGEVVKLTVVHGGFPYESAVRRSIGQGWPGIIAGLKTLLETGEPMPQPVPAQN